MTTTGTRSARVRTLAVACTATVGVGLATSCAGPGASPAAPSLAGAVGSTVPRRDPLAGTTLIVFAAASLSEAFGDARALLEREHPGLSVTVSFAGSQLLVAQVRQGAPADLLATADDVSMRALVGDGLVEQPVVFARNRLEIVVAPGNPKHISGLTDLSRPGLRVVLADASVPAGRYGRHILEAHGVRVAPVSEPLDVKGVVLAVAEGNADAGIVYATDVAAAGSAVGGVPIPPEDNVLATYEIAVVRRSAHPAAARAFLEAVVAGRVQEALRARGFLPP